MKRRELNNIVGTLVAGDKGVLAMDESTPTCNKLFAKLGIPQTEEARRAWRELIVTTPRLGECNSGVVLYGETIRQRETNAANRIGVARLDVPSHLPSDGLKSLPQLKF